MLGSKNEFQKLIMTKEVLKAEIISEFTRTLVEEVEKQVSKKGKAAYIKSLE